MFRAWGVSFFTEWWATFEGHCACDGHTNFLGHPQLVVGAFASGRFSSGASPVAELVSLLGSVLTVEVCGSDP